MYVFRRVAVLMMPAVESDPIKQESLDSHRPENGKDEFHSNDCLKRAVGEESVETDSNTKESRGVHAEQEREVDPVEAPPPEQQAGNYQAAQWDGNSEKGSNSPNK
jgi:hypothetical protein